VFLIQKYFCRGVPPVGLLLSAPGPTCQSPISIKVPTACVWVDGAGPKPPPLFPLLTTCVRSPSPPARAPPLRRVSAPHRRPSPCRPPSHAIHSPRRSAPSRAVPSERFRSRPSNPSAPLLLRRLPRAPCPLPLLGAPLLLSVAASPAALQHRCPLRPPPCRASARSRACQRRGSRLSLCK
jgi:hypothetical protein